MIKNNLIFLTLFFLLSCSAIDFSYKEDMDITNPIYNKVGYFFSGKEIVGIYGFASVSLGRNKTPEYTLDINIKEEKTKKSVQKNQVVSKIDYSLTFGYLLQNISTNCVVYKEEIVSRFSYTPKSSGENFGSDISLEKKYELVGRENLSIFLKNINGRPLNICIDEN